MGDEPKKNDGLIVWVTYPRGRILSKLHAFLRNSFNTRSLLATFLDECRSTRSFLVISNNLESHRAIPFTKAKTWSSFWRPSSKYKIPSSDLLYPNNLESHLAIPFIQKLKFKVPSGDLHRNMRSLLAISFNLGIPSGDSFYSKLKYDVVLPDGRAQNFSFFFYFLFFLLSQNPLWFETVILCYRPLWFFLRLQSCWNVLRTPSAMIQKVYMQWFMIRCHACIRTWFWNIGPILFF